MVERCPALLAVGGNLVMKVFEGGAYMDLVKRIEKLFEDAKGFKPKALRSESTEMYIVAHGWRGIDPKSLIERPTDLNVLAPPRPTPRPGWSTR